MSYLEKSLIKRSFDYCTYNKKFLALMIVLLIIITFIDEYPKYDLLELITSITIIILITGYGLHITQDIINFGKRLPKIEPKKLIKLGVKGSVILTITFLFQSVLLHFIAVNLNFPKIEVKEVFLNIPTIIRLFYVHNPVHTVIFILLSFAITYITVFFMEMALAQLADGGKFINSFNIIHIKKIIDKIGWKNYSADYTLVILSICILTYINIHLPNIAYVSFIVSLFLKLMIIVIEFGSIGLIYREIK